MQKCDKIITHLIISCLTAGCSTCLKLIIKIEKCFYIIIRWRLIIPSFKEALNRGDKLTMTKTILLDISAS
jgi:hypothetical protein